MKILINHLTGLIINGVPAEATWTKKVQAAAKYPNVSCKVSGIFQRSNRSPAPKKVGYYAAIFEVVYEAFGEDRIIYGSNWPVCERAGTYARCIRIVRAYFAAKGVEATEKFFWRNSQAVYGWKAR